MERHGLTPGKSRNLAKLLFILFNGKHHIYFTGLVCELNGNVIALCKCPLSPRADVKMALVIKENGIQPSVGSLEISLRSRQLFMSQSWGLNPRPLNLGTSQSFVLIIFILKCGLTKLINCPNWA